MYTLKVVPPIALAVALSGCTPDTAPGKDTNDTGGPLEVVGASYSLDVTLIPPLNDMGLFSDVTSLHVWFELEDGSKVEVGTYTDLSSDVSATDLPEVAGATLIMQGKDAGGAPILVGRAGPFNLAENQISTNMIIGRIGKLNWLPTLPEGRAGGAVVADGLGGFLLFGGTEANPRSYTEGSDEVWRLDFLNPNANATWESAGVLPARGGTSTKLGHVGISANFIGGTSDLGGQVLVMGGAPTWTDGDSGATDQIILWDPATSTPSTIVMAEDEFSLRSKRFFHVVVEDGRGRLIVGGGWMPTEQGYSLEVRESLEVIDPSVPSEEPVSGSPISGMALHAGALDAQENVIFCGGAQSGPPVDDFIVNVAMYDGCDVINAAGDLIGGTALPGGPLVLHQMTALPDEQVVLTGGLPPNDTAYDGETEIPVITFGGDVDPLSLAWLWDGAAWTPAADMVTARAMHAAVPLPDGTLLIVGGVSTNVGPYPTGNDAIACADIYDPAAGPSPLSDCDISDPSGDLEAASSLPMTATDPGIGVIVVGGIGRSSTAVDAVAWFPFAAE